jgi:hypothetical protein
MKSVYLMPAVAKTVNSPQSYASVSSTHSATNTQTNLVNQKSTVNEGQTDYSGQMEHTAYVAKGTYGVLILHTAYVDSYIRRM